MDNIRVGIVDDDESICRSLARLLRAAGMKAASYRSAEEFLASSVHSGYDCLMLDVQLPGMSGIDLRDQLATEGNMTPVIFVTAHDDPLAGEKAQAGRCSGYFRKSDNGRKLIDAIQKAVSGLPSCNTK